jgi:hypothetical protein
MVTIAGAMNCALVTAWPFAGQAGKKVRRKKADIGVCLLRQCGIGAAKEIE